MQKKEEGEKERETIRNTRGKKEINKIDEDYGDI